MKQDVWNKDNPNKGKILCIIPSVPLDFNYATLRSVFQQTIPIDMIAILPKKVYASTTGKKLSKVLNDGISHIRLEDFDYILRVDGDTILPRDFLEKNLEEDPDLRSGAGNAMLIKVKPFLEVMDGKFHVESDDTYLSFKFMKEGLKVLQRDIDGVMFTRKAGRHHGLKYFLDRGKSMYKHGYEPLHVLLSFVWEPFNVLSIFSYVYCVLIRAKKLDVADFVWHEQVKRLFSL